MRANCRCPTDHSLFILDCTYMILLSYDDMSHLASKRAPRFPTVGHSLARLGLELGASTSHLL